MVRMGLFTIVVLLGVVAVGQAQHVEPGPASAPVPLAKPDCHGCKGRHGWNILGWLFYFPAKNHKSCPCKRCAPTCRPPLYLYCLYPSGGCCPDPVHHHGRQEGHHHTLCHFGGCAADHGEQVTPRVLSGR